MISPVFLWIPALVLGLAGLAAIAFWAWKRRPAPAPRPLPAEWHLSPRPVFSTDERRVYRLLREALPYHAILSKLPLVRFSQPDDPNEVRYWYELLGTIHVAFAICSSNGRVLAAIDLDTDHANSRRTLQIKQAVLAACKVRYLRCPMDSLPTVAELQSLVPQAAAPRPPRQAPEPPPEAPAPMHTGMNGIARPSRAAAPLPMSPMPPIPPSTPGESNALWQDSVPYHDSFFALETRHEGSTDFGGLAPPRAPRHYTVDLSTDDLGGLVNDLPDDPPPRRR